MFDQQIIDSLSPLSDVEIQAKAGLEPKWIKDIQRKNLITLDKEKMLNSGIMLSLSRHPRYVQFPLHKHDHVELTIMIQGNSVHHVNGKTVEMKEGEILFLMQKSQHKVDLLEKNDIALYINILPEFFGKIFGSLENKDTVIRRFCLDSLARGEAGTFLHYRVSQDYRIQNLLNFIVYDLLFKPTMYKEAAEGSFGLLMKLLQTCTDNLDTYVPSQEAIMPVVRRYIEDKYKSASLEELSSQLHYNKSSLSRFIRKKSGKNFIELLQNKRLSVAEKLLCDSEKSVAEIAEEVGYNNASYFYKLFNKTYGVSPSNYRSSK
ncbi:MAG: AraC family transcriptional regulator [Bilifractor sp.]|jgi:AraC family L-rhamnose operon regulatory protein RhaS